MNDPYQLLGIAPGASTQEIRHAYHLAAKKLHPDRFQDPRKQEQAQEQMADLNQAYHMAMRSAALREGSVYQQTLSSEEAVKLCGRMLDQNYPEGGLRELLRSDTKSPAWYYMQGRALLMLKQYEAAYQSFRQAVRREPENNEFRAGALQGEIALRNSRTILGRLRRSIDRAFRR